MAINIEEILINKVRTLPPETQQQVLDFLEALPPAEHPKQTIWEIRLNSVLKLDRAEKANPEEPEHEDVNTEETAA